MSDIKLFRLKEGQASELVAESMDLERSLQSLIEKNLEPLLGVRFLASEYSTGKTHRGRIDTLGIDENDCPVILEYKRAASQNVINQGLFYLNWLLDHKAEYQVLVMKRLGKEASESIEWSTPRLLCVAADFTRYDEHAVLEISRNIDLIRYRRFSDDLLLLELVNSAVVTEAITEDGKPAKGAHGYRTITDTIEGLDGPLLELFESVRAYLLALGDDVQERMLKLYVAFRRLKNFACVEVRPTRASILVYARVDPSSVSLEEGFTRDVQNIGHYGTGNLEIIISNADDLERAKPLLLKAYEAG